MPKSNMSNIFNKKRKLLAIFAIIPIVIFGIFIGSTDFLKEDTATLEMPVYIPSDITKASSLFIQNDEVQDLWKTILIEDVKDYVVYTIKGTVLSIDDPIDWDTGNKVGGIDHIIGFIPITIAVEEVYKGDLTDLEFTFYVPSYKFGDADMYNIYPDTANFEIGENILIHLGYSDLGSFPDGHYYPKLAQFGKYQLQTPVGIASASDNVLAFNVLHPNGISLDSVSGEALP